MKTYYLPFACALVTLIGCTELNTADRYPDPYYGSGRRYDRYDYDRDYYDRRDYENARRERRDLERERERLERERERIDRERNTYKPPPPPPPRREECPRGFSPSENKCTKEERRRGCQDMRLPGGLGCVKR